MMRLVAGLVDQESSWNPIAVSPTGHTGLGQLSPSIARYFGVKNRKDPYQNLMGTTAYLAHNFAQYNGNVDLVLADYHCGMRAVKAAKGRIPNCHDKAAGITTPQYVAMVRKKAGV